MNRKKDDLDLNGNGGRGIPSTNLSAMSEDLNPSPHPTLRQIAKEAGVALSTVSAALRGRPGASQETSRHVQEIAERMGWRPNPLVSAWLTHVRQGRPASWSGSLAYLVNDVDGLSALFQDPKRFIHRAYWKGAKERAARRGYTLEAFDYRQFGGKRISSILRSRNIQGVVLAPLGNLSLEFAFDWDRFALGTIAYSHVKPEVHRAANHHFHTVDLCLEHLYVRGYRRVGMAMRRESIMRSGGMFLGAYLAGVYKYPEMQRLEPFIPEESGFHRDGFHFWLQQEKPDVVISVQTIVPQWLKELGYRFPEELGYVHLDLPPKEELALDYAGVDQQPERIGAAVIDLVTAQIDRNERGIPESPKVSLVESRWVEGNSILKHSVKPAPRSRKRQKSVGFKK